MPAGTAVPAGVARTPAYDGPDARVWRVVDPLPRAFVACDWQVSGRSAAASTLSATTDPAELRDRPLVEGVVAPATDCATPARPARIVRDDPTRVDVDVAGSAPGRLVLLDTFYPGWKAEVDGRSAPIAAANVAFRSVALPAGARRVSFSYEPASVPAGLAISVVAWLVIFGLGLGALVARRRDRAAT
jgi:Bacterial membrane protein YfhO